MIKVLLQITVITIMVLFASVVRADSFFDVFFDVTYDKASQAPQLNAMGRVITFGSGARVVETEMLSMSLSSHRGREPGTMQYSATVAVRSWVPTNDGDTQRVDSFFDIFYECASTPDRGTSCMVTKTSVKSKGDHRGHVTVLK